MINKIMIKPSQLSWAIVLASGLLSSGAAMALEVDGGSFTSDTIPLRDIGNTATSDTTTIPVSSCAPGTLSRMVISYTSSMESNYTFENISGAEANLTATIAHSQLDLSVGTLPAEHPALNSYAESWRSTNTPPNAVPVGGTQLTVSPAVPQDPTVLSSMSGFTPAAYTTNLAQFESGNPAATVTLTAAADKTETAPGTWQSDNVTIAEGSVSVQYFCELPDTTLTCAAQLGAEGDTVTATLSGGESCSEIAITETISCTDLGYTPASDPANCSITENPAGTLSMTCTTADVIAANGSKDYRLIGDITGDEGNCSTQVTAMSCTTPTAQNIVADTANCGDTYSRVVVKPPTIIPKDVRPVPTLSEWALMLLAGLMGLVGIKASRRSV